MLEAEDKLDVGVVEESIHCLGVWPRGQCVSNMQGPGVKSLAAKFKNKLNDREGDRVPRVGGGLCWDV